MVEKEGGYIHVRRAELTQQAERSGQGEENSDRGEGKNSEM